ncbi:MAG: hypothetical protein ABMA26_09400 [Limisphaerales bacterium]
MDPTQVHMDKKRAKLKLYRNLIFFIALLKSVVTEFNRPDLSASQTSAVVLALVFCVNVTIGLLEFFLTVNGFGLIVLYVGLYYWSKAPPKEGE